MKDVISYIKKEQKKIKSIVTDKFRDYYLTGGTALSFYFNHRFSEDLDFFTQEYKRDDPDKIMDFVSKETGFPFKLETEQNNPKLVPMKVYFMELKKGNILKIDFVQDYMKNIQSVEKGLHSVEDIYIRKVSIAVGGKERESVTGRMLPVGRQTARDFYDICYLSKNYKLLSVFFLRHFPKNKAERLISWHRTFNRMDLKMELIDLVPGADTAEILKHLDEEILKKLPDKLIK